MRPLELRLRNFRSYFGKETVFDFRDRRLVGIVGPIGSGKSSILDAIAFALYGRTPAVSAATKSLIHQRADEGAVSLRFEVDGQVWEAVRSLRRKGAGQHALYRYEADGAEDPIEKIMLESEVTEQVGKLLGLEFDAFSRSVLLAQGRFAEFLQATPVERDRVLKGLFGHERLTVMRDLARDRAAAADVEVARLEARLEQRDRLVGELAAIADSLQAAGVRLGSLEALRPAVSRLEDAIEAKAAAAKAADSRRVILSERLTLLPDRRRVDDIGADVAAAGEARSKVAAEMEKARQELAAADAAMAEARQEGLAARIEEASGRIAVLSPLEDRAADATHRRDLVAGRLDKAIAEAAGAAAGATSAGAALAKAEDTLRAAIEDLAGASAVLHEAEHGDMVAALRRGLVSGDACPVCEQVVAVVPSAQPPESLEAARRGLETAEAARAQAERARVSAAEAATIAKEGARAVQDSVGRLEAELAQGDKEVAAASSEVAAAVGSLAGILGPGDPKTLLEGLRGRLAGLESDVAEARKRVDRFRAEHDQTIRREQEAARASAALHVELTDAAARAGVPLSIGEDEQLPAVLDRLRDAIERERAEAEADAAAAAGELEDSRRQLRDLYGAHGVAESLAAEIGSVGARLELLDQQHAERVAAVEESKDAALKRESVRSEAGIYRRIASDLTDARFVRYLLDTERTRLAVLGSEHFLRLSSGRYVFATDGNFGVRDQTAADAERKSDSLSGGETFLASLALALALAEMVSRAGGRLDSFFLDEGFGSLDPTHLDLAMDGIEALVAGESERLVVVVSHVSEMRHRIEDIIELERDPTTGDTRVTSGASIRKEAASLSA